MRLKLLELFSDSLLQVDEVRRRYIEKNCFDTFTQREQAKKILGIFV
jgi:hypothetical protein